MKPSLFLLPRHIEHSLRNRQWLDCAMQWQRAGGTSCVIAPDGDLGIDYSRLAIRRHVLAEDNTPWTAWHNRRLIGGLVKHQQPAQIWFQDIRRWKDMAHINLPHTRLRYFLDEAPPVTRFNRTMLARFVATKGELIISNHVVGEQLQRDYGLLPHQLQFLPPAVDLAVFDAYQIKPERALSLAAAWRIPENAALFLCSADSVPYHGQIAALQALAKTGRHDVYMVIMGGAAEHIPNNPLMRVIQQVGLAGQVRFIPRCGDIAAALWLAQGVIGCNGDSSAATPDLLLLAAQAMGRPVIVSDIPMHNSLIEPNGNTAMLYRPHDQNGLHQAIGAVLAMGEKARQRYGVYSREWVAQTFSYSAWRHAMVGEASLAAPVPSPRHQRDAA